MRKCNRHLIHRPCGGTNDGTYATDWLYNNGTWPAAFVGAAYPSMLDLAIYEGMGAPGKEYQTDNVMLGRAAWAGAQRFGGAVWSGDTQVCTQMTPGCLWNTS